MLEERQIHGENRKMEAFEQELERTMGTYRDDMAKLLSKGELPPNDKDPDDEID